MEAECAKHERTLKILENKLKAHEDNIQAMKSDLALREEELQVTRAAPNLFNRLHLAVFHAFIRGFSSYSIFPVFSCTKLYRSASKLNQRDDSLPPE